MRASKALAKLRAGKVAIGANVNLGPSVITPGLAGKLGMDFVWIDMEHRWFSFGDTALIILSARDGGADPMVRVRDTIPSTLARCYELGATAVMVPHCKSKAEAEHVAAFSKFYPVGRRGMENVLVDADYGLQSITDFMDWHNRETFTVVQIEDREAVDVVDDIAATPGIDVLFVGPADLSTSYGMAGQTWGPHIVDAFQRVVRACEKHKKHPGLPTGSNTERVKMFLDLGARFIVPCGDFGAVLGSWKKTTEDVGNLLAKQGLA